MKTKYQRVVLRIPATLYAYYDLTPEQVASLATQEGINKVVAEVACQEVSEPDESAEWSVEEIGTPL